MTDHVTPLLLEAWRPVVVANKILPPTDRKYEYFISRIWNKAKGVVTIQKLNYDEWSVYCLIISPNLYIVHEIVEFCKHLIML